MRIMLSSFRAKRKKMSLQNLQKSFKDLKNLLHYKNSVLEDLSIYSQLEWTMCFLVAEASAEE